MPIYEYECTTCGTQLEVTQRMTDPPLTRCEPCGTDSLQKLVSRSAFQLKGGGWYSDLYSSTSKDSGKSKTGTSESQGASASAPAAPASAPASSAAGSSSAGA